MPGGDIANIYVADRGIFVPAKHGLNGFSASSTARLVDTSGCSPCHPGRVCESISKDTSLRIIIVGLNKTKSTATCNELSDDN